MPEKIILFDTEYTAWEGSQARRWSGDGEHREIIQIAAARVTLAGGLAAEEWFRCYVRPVRNPSLSEYIVGLTGITQSVIDAHGAPFTNAFTDFYQFSGSGRYPLFSWGDDPGVLQENCRLNEILFPEFQSGFHDIRDVFEGAGIATEGYTSGTVWQALGLEDQLPAHDALNDVRSLLATLQALEKQGKFLF